MKLIGSTTSPYVRRVRLLLSGQDYEFETLKALSPEGTKKLASYGPINRIPILVVDNKTIFDSTIICEYLLEQQSIHLSIDEKLNLRLINELCDAGIILFQQKLWEIDSNWVNEFSKRMLKRANSIIDELESMLKQKKLSELEKDWLYCVLDWFEFRNVLNWKQDHTQLEKFYEKSQSLPKYLQTQLIS